MVSDEQSVQTVPENNKSWSAESLPEKQAKKQRTRLRCNWKDCRYNAASLSELEIHVERHQKCPKDDCPWKDGGDEKEKSRHVWKIHGKWATQNNYPSIGGECSICGMKFTRQDYVIRHHRRKHGGRAENAV
ncbi:hypothetical protein ACKVV1_011543 [Pyricularia oryzae]